MSFAGDPVAYVESTFGIRLKKVGKGEHAGPCPWCAGKDRFHVWDRGNFVCRPGLGHCGRSGWLDELDGVKAPTDQQRLEWRVAALERQAKEHEERLSILERMARCTDHLAYHRNLYANNGAKADYWLGEGFTVQTIDRFMLGYCPSCPTYPPSPSYTIPVTYQGTLYNIRHRLEKPTNGGKYRPHLAGLPAMLFNADDLKAEDASLLLVVEGEKKAMIVSQETALPVVGTMGKQAFKPEWVPKAQRFATVVVCYDPDATEEARATAALFGQRGRVMLLPTKADDFFVQHGGSKASFARFVEIARPAKEA